MALGCSCPQDRGWNFSQNREAVAQDPQETDMSTPCCVGSEHTARTQLTVMAPAQPRGPALCIGSCGLGNLMGACHTSSPRSTEQSWHWGHIHRLQPCLPEWKTHSQLLRNKRKSEWAQVLCSWATESSHACMCPIYEWMHGLTEMPYFWVQSDLLICLKGGMPMQWLMTNFFKRNELLFAKTERSYLT